MTAKSSLHEESDQFAGEAMIKRTPQEKPGLANVSPRADNISASLPHSSATDEDAVEFTIETEDSPPQDPAQNAGTPGMEGSGPDGIPVMLIPMGNSRGSPFLAGSQMAMLVSSSPSGQLQGLPNSEDETGPSLESIVRSTLRMAAFLRQHTLFLVLMSILGLAGGAASKDILPPAHTAKAEITLHPEPKVNPVDPNSRQNPSDTPELYASAERTFTSPEAVRSTLKAMNKYSFDDELVDLVARGLKFESVGIRDFVATVNLKSRARDELNPVDFLNVHLKLYAQSEIDKMLKVFIAQVDFLRTQTATAEAELKRIEAETVAFRQAHAGQLADQATLSPQNRSSLEQRRFELTGQILRLEGALASVHRQIQRGSHLERTKVQYAQSYRDALTIVNRDLGEARGKGYADGHPEIKRLLAEKANLESMMAEQLHSDLSGIDKRSNAADEALQGTADQTESQLSAARAEREFIMNSLQKLNRVSGNQPEIDARMDELTRQEVGAKRIHEQLFDRMRQSEVQLELERVSAASRFELTKPPKEEPLRIKRLFALRMTIGLIAGLAVAFAILFFGIARRFVAKVSATTALTLLALAANGCAHDPAFVWVQDVPSDYPTTVVSIQPRDTISIEIEGQANLSGEMVVRDDGKYFNTLVGVVPLTGLTPVQAAAALREKVKAVVVNPVVTVSMVKAAPIHVGVMGEVKNPGSYELSRDRRLSTALLAAGWTTEFAHDDRIFVLRPTGQHPRIRFRLRDLTTSEPHAAQFQLLDGDLISIE
jgi:polysaccharide export outer membrane protein